MPKMTEAHFAARRRQVLEATFRCLAQKGYARTKIKDIAGEAGLSVGTLYLYFKNKEEMVRALSDEMRTQTDTSIEQHFSDADPLANIASVFEFLFRRFDDPASEETLRVDLQIWAEAIHHPELREMFQAGLDDRIEKFGILIRQAQQDGSLPQSIDPAALARIFMAITTGLRLQKMMQPEFSVEALLPSLRALLAHDEGA